MYTKNLLLTYYYTIAQTTVNYQQQQVDDLCIVLGRFILPSKKKRLHISRVELDQNIKEKEKKKLPLFIKDYKYIGIYVKVHIFI